MPIQLTFSGSYFDLTSVLYDLRNLVRVRDGELSADGRLFTLDQLDLHESQSGFPEIEALLTVSAYTFGATGPTDAAGVPAVPQIPEAPAPAPANGDSDSTETDPGDEEAPTFEVDPSTPPALPDEDEDEGEDT